MIRTVFILSVAFMLGWSQAFAGYIDKRNTLFKNGFNTPGYFDFSSETGSMFGESISKLGARIGWQVYRYNNFVSATLGYGGAFNDYSETLNQSKTYESFELFYHGPIVAGHFFLDKRFGGSVYLMYGSGKVEAKVKDIEEKVDENFAVNELGLLADYVVINQIQAIAGMNFRVASSPSDDLEDESTSVSLLVGVRGSLL